MDEAFQNISNVYLGKVSFFVNGYSIPVSMNLWHNFGYSLTEIRMNNGAEDIERRLDAVLEIDPPSRAALPPTLLLAVGGPDGGSWLIRPQSVPRVERLAGSSPARADCRVEISSAALSSIALGGGNPQELFASGELRIFGTLDAALRANAFFDALARASRAGGGG